MELHDLKRMLQRHFTDGLVTVVGSGLSCAEGLPGMSELASHLEATVTTGLAAVDIQRWKEISPLLTVKGLEAALLEKPPTPALEAAIVARTTELIAAREKKIVAEVFSRARTLRFTHLVNFLPKPHNGVPIVTTNYDRLIEVAVEEGGLGVDTLFVGQYAGELNEKESRLSFLREVKKQGSTIQYRFRERANVFKPHGSLDWFHRDGKPVRYTGELDHPRLIITPGLNKFRNGYESPFDRHRERANLAIDQASRFLIIGYGFNDDHLETHLTPRIRYGAETVLLARTLSDNALKLLKESPKMIAIQHAKEDGVAGSRVWIGGDRAFYQGLALWDLGEFVAAVLEP